MERVKRRENGGWYRIVFGVSRKIIVVIMVVCSVRFCQGLGFKEKWGILDQSYTPIHTVLFFLLCLHIVSIL